MFFEIQVLTYLSRQIWLFFAVAGFLKYIYFSLFLMDAADAETAASIKGFKRAVFVAAPGQQRRDVNQPDAADAAPTPKIVSRNIEKEGFDAADAAPTP